MKNNLLKMTTILCSICALPNALLADTETTTASGNTVYAGVDGGDTKGGYVSVDGSKGAVSVGASEKELNNYTS